MHILVVEDEQRVADAIKRSLEANGFQVDIIIDSGQAVKVASKPQYDLIIMDRMLPGPYDGLSIAKSLREHNISTPILMLTALGDVSHKVEGLTGGADDYLVKPFSIKELNARVNVLLRRPKINIGSVLKVDNLELDTHSFEAKRAGKVIELSAREYKLLNYLMYNKGEILSKDKIISHVWDADSIILPNTVEVYIGYLRKKIDKAFPDEQPLIHTVFGFGYRIGN